MLMKTTPGEATAANWSAVVAMSLCVFVLIASEFLPVSLLTPIAGELTLSEGQAGQAISVSGIFAVATSLFISFVSRGLDRKTVLLSLVALMCGSGAVVGLAPNYTVLMVGRAFLGIVIGGFWSMSTATIMRLVPESDVPRALAFLNGGNALAATIAAPLGSFLGGLIGWRGAFLCVVPLAAVAACWLAFSLPRMQGGSASGATATFRLLGRPAVAAGMAAVFFLFMGQFALFTYLRPFLETVTHVGVPILSLLLLIVGIAGFAGTMFIGQLLSKTLYGVLVFAPLSMALIAVALSLFGGWVFATAMLLALWGLATSGPVGWGVWLTRSMPRDAEAGGGLMVANIQLAITLGATTGGVLFDAFGYEATFLTSAGILVVGALLACLSYRLSRNEI
ncbi:MFS transporter [Rhizobium ruizarguesonis]|uniref:MFS transporter n=1 Tax=Rhizobium ruizarguesonis TaxID=2081791 RepID=UPI0013C02DEB|nr:MFS transporter [Rhizobium ruizarguesonis]NEI96545.1 MFS transporter [Rhizobium ruizarguesonis]NEJ33832.1 MFS transporter [Rhizobium ruizarguesonis]